MTRPLGSFNQRLKLDKKPEDHARIADERLAKNPEAILGYDLGLNRNYYAREESTATNAEKFVSGRGRAPRSSSNMRMAGVELRNQMQQP